MLNNHYEVETSSDFKTYQFISIGPKGSVIKVVLYSEINVKDFYNLGFGDKDSMTGYLNDLTITNNGDSQKVLLTVAATLFTFIDNHPDAIVIATGSTEARTRLYRMGIAKNLEAIEKDFIILGLNDNNWQIFRGNISYDAFLIRQRL